jgi:glutamyl-tRNA reductase
VSIILVGLNHQSAPVALREQLALSGGSLDLALTELNAIRSRPERSNGHAPSGGIHESVILSTCNRLEVYAVVGDAAGGFVAIEGLLAGLRGLTLEELHPHCT